MLTIDLHQKVALVLGGSRGIGEATTRCLYRAGAITFFTHTGNPNYREHVDTLCSTLRKEGGTVQAAAVDACNSSETTALVDRIILEQKKIDILVCNVGQNVARPAETVSDAEWRHYLDLNLTSAFYGVRAALPHMIKAHFGRIILIGSSAVVDGGGGAIDYAAAKAGLDGMMLYLCKQYTRQGILTNIIHPCLIDTDLLRNRYSPEEQQKKLLPQVPAGRLGTPQDIAGMVTYLASSWGDYICGQSILIDGGRTLFK